MVIKYLKFIFFLIILNQTPLYSKIKIFNDFNASQLSNYFSGIVAYENKENTDALKFFNASRHLTRSHDPYLKRFIYSLVLENKIKQAVNEIKNNRKTNNSDFFEAYILLAIDSIKKNNFIESRKYLLNSYEKIQNNRFKLVIYESLNEYLTVFEKKKIFSNRNKFGNLSFINEVFQRCYLDDKNTEQYFISLINNSEDKDYSRYTFFLLNHLAEKNKINEAKKITNKLEFLKSSLLIAQGKKWIEENKTNELSKIFSCKNHNDVISEFFFLIANLYSAKDNYEKSNFYLNLSNFINPKFRFNLTLLAENYYLNNDYKKTKKILKNFDESDDFYYWFKIKTEGKIISQKENNIEALNFVNKKFKKIKNPSVKILLDLANLNKNSKRYKEAIIYYDQVILKTKINTDIYGNVLYRRGSSYERLGEFSKSDKDFLKAIEINPNDAYSLNYLAYSWLERNYKIQTAIKMLERAYALKKNDPYIIDSIGWAYYLIDDYNKAELFLKRAVELMPDDPIVNDHYGDILWKLNRRIQARYFWTSVLGLDGTDDKLKEIINLKLIEGLKNS